ncbi:hypothetical protein AHiyo8_pI69860 (plasmid) [Arthrobacter sp. Hiyo8]|nr:hypothetical protein AHiyo8_pI69860 [Arthrobacter sp. Hiyo8]
MPGEFIWTGVAVLLALLAIATWLGIRETRIRKALMEDVRSASGTDLAYQWP